MEITPYNTLSFIDMSEFHITFQEAYRRIQDCAQNLMDGAEHEIRAMDYHLAYCNLEYADEQEILKKAYASIYFDHESELVNVDEDEWFDSDLYDLCCAYLEWYFDNETLENYPCQPKLNSKKN